MKIKELLLAITFLFCGCKNQEEFPTVSWKGNPDKPMIFYISGDAGFNTFSKDLGKNLQLQGYDVYALNTKQYFWNGKTPEIAAQDVSRFLNAKDENRRNKNIILLGFSYGADVLPFIYNRLDENIKQKISKTIIIGPSKFNDFKIHLTDYLGAESNSGYPVIPEINNTKNIPMLLILSDFEFKYFPYQQITRQNAYFKMMHIHGDHHFGGNTKMLSQVLAKYIE